MYVFTILVSTSKAVNEFQFLNNLRDKYSLDKVGDDCAVLPKDAESDMLLTCDMLVEDIDFRLEWTPPASLGHKALAVSLSDIAAMGGTPKWAMLSLGVPEHLWRSGYIDEFYAGWFALASQFGVELAGGDISRVPDKLFIDSVAGGEVPRGKATMRSGAKPFDAIYVTGSLGGAAGGLKMLERGSEKTRDSPISTADLIHKLLKPAPQLTRAKLLQSLGVANSMIDISDGLSSDLFHICHQSGVGASIVAEKLPINTDLAGFFNTQQSLDMALHGGEDFELLFTVDKKNISLIESVPATCIGEITDTGFIELIRNGDSEKLEPRGYRHF